MLKKHGPKIVITFFFITIFLLSALPLSDFDIWFHLKSGEIISQQGIIRRDVFAFTTNGREWSPYEWLFQVSFFHIRQLFGLEGVKYATTIISTTIIFLSYLILRYIFNVSWYLSLILSFLFFTTVFDFMLPRPQIFGYLFLMLNLYLILNYFFHHKNWLVLSLMFTLIWANSHGSVFLGPLLFLLFSIICLINFFQSKQKSWFNKFKILAIYTILNSIFTLLPPLGALQYQLLWRFYQNRQIISRFISEWAPLSVNPVPFYIFLSSALLVIVIFLTISLRKKTLKENLWILALVPLILGSFIASRNVFYGYLALVLLLGSIFANFRLKNYPNKIKVILLLILSALMAFHIWMLNDKRSQQNLEALYYPVKAAKFIKDFQLKGNMFNEYGYGGYLLYHLYPEQKVYMDGRTDLYLCCEMPDILELAAKKNLPDEEYKKVLDNLWQKNHISFVLMRVEKHVLLRKIARILQDDPEWSLVFWDDASVLFVRKDNQNDLIIAEFGTVAATPYNKDPYKENTSDKALREYQRMIKIADSAKSRNVIGFILLKKGQYDGAKKQFNEAIRLNPLAESSYMNLGELAAHDGDLKTAIQLYEKARQLAPDRGLIYVRLGQLMLKSGADKGDVIKIWQEGVEKTVDDEAKNTLKELLAS